jgi:hypothetical protein
VVNLRIGTVRDIDLESLPDAPKFPMAVLWDESSGTLFTAGYAGTPAGRAVQVTSTDLRTRRTRSALVNLNSVHMDSQARGLPSVHSLALAYSRLFLLLTGPNDEDPHLSFKSLTAPPKRAAVVELDPGTLKQLGLIDIDNLDTRKATLRRMMAYGSSMIMPFGTGLQVKLGPTISIIGPDRVEASVTDSKITYKRAALVDDWLVYDDTTTEAFRDQKFLLRCKKVNLSLSATPTTPTGR